MTSQWWSWALTGVGVTCMYLVGRQRTYGWLLSVAAQLLWLTYAIATRQWGFILSAGLYGGIYTLNWLRWRRRDRADELHEWFARGPIGETRE